MSLIQAARRAFLLQEFAVSLAFAAAFTAQAVYLVEVLALSPLQLVLIGTVLELSCFLLEIPTGVVADVYSRRRSVLLGFAFLGLSFLVVVLGGSFLAVLLAQVVAGFGYTFLSGAQSAWITDEVGESNVGALFIKGAQVGRVGSLIGLGLAAWLGQYSLAAPLSLGAGVLLALAGVLVFVMPETNFTPHRADGSAWRAMGETFKEGVRTVRVRPVLLALLGAAVLYGASTEAIDRLSQLHLLKSFAFPDLLGLEPIAWFSLLGAVGTLVNLVVTQALLRRLETSDVPRIARQLAWIGALGAGGVLAFALVGQFWLAVVVLLVMGVLRGLYEPLYHAWLNQGLDSRVRATVLSIASQADALGQVAGGPGVGALGNVFGVRTALGVSALLRLPVLLVLAWGARRAERSVTATD